MFKPKHYLNKEQNRSISRGGGGEIYRKEEILVILDWTAVEVKGNLYYSSLICFQEKFALILDAQIIQIYKWTLLCAGIEVKALRLADR